MFNPYPQMSLTNASVKHLSIISATALGNAKDKIKPHYLARAHWLRGRPLIIWGWRGEEIYGIDFFLRASGLYMSPPVPMHVRLFHFSQLFIYFIFFFLSPHHQID